MRIYTIFRSPVLGVFLVGCLLPVLATASLVAAPPVEKKHKKQIRIARKLVFPVSVKSKSSFAAASLKYLQSKKSIPSPRAVGSAKTRKSRPQAKLSNTRPTTSQGVYDYLARKRLTVVYNELSWYGGMDSSSSAFP